ncbi:hypothetical protein QTP88_016331 [Uroleucon formosanum]
MFCYEEDRYSIDISPKDATTKFPLTDKTVSTANFYSYKIMVRKELDNHLLRYGPLFNQYLVDMYAKIETERLNFIRNHQNKLRADKYIHLKDDVRRQDIDADQLGKLVVLPLSFTGGPRFMHVRAQDALTYVRHYGSSDLFVTFTCNLIWQKIQEALLRGQKHYHRPDIIARVFNRKVKELMDLLTKRDLFGKMYDIVKTNMIHGPCGLLNKNSPCMKEGVCSKSYLVTFIQETQRGEDGYPKYKRRSTNDGGFKASIKSIDLDNMWVVPYNPVLLRTFSARINIEITSLIKFIKYVCKYVTKGSDHAAFGLGKTDNTDEIKIYKSGRYISSSEAAWKILGFHIHDRYPAITHLDVHLENGQRVYFTVNNVAERIENPPTTTLQAFFQICQTDNFARTLLYPKVASLGWPGVKKDTALGRVYTIHPNNVECYHLHLLLHYIKGPTSYSFLKTVNNIEYPKFQATCKALGLLEDDNQWDFALEEAALSRSPNKMRELFSVILIFCHPSDASSLWTKYKDDFSDNIRRQYYRQHLENNITDSELYNKSLVLMEDFVLNLGGNNLKEYDAPGGTGKTHLINILLAKVRSSYGIAITAASSGIAATLLHGGKTAHSAFKLPLNLNTIEIPTCNINKQSNMANVLKKCKLIVWDECPMSHKKGFEALNNCLKDLRNSNVLIGGVTVLLAGDFRQTLPIVPRGTRANKIAACTKSSYLWPKIEKFSLTKNMRVHLKEHKTAEQFSELLLKIGDGKYPECEENITLPTGLGTVVNNLQELTYKIYPGIENLKEISMD